MKHSISNWQTAGFLFTAALGSFLHFLFDLAGQNWIAALFSAVNESIWEHMKLLFYPMFLFSFLEYRFWGKNNPQFWCIKLVGILVGLVLIPVLYYSYTGIIGKNLDWFNIAIFFLAAGAAYRWEAILSRKGSPCRISDRRALTVLAAIGLLFTLVTFFPPKIPFFQDPLTGTYGFQR